MNNLYFVKYENYIEEGGDDLIDFHTYTGEDVYTYSDSYTYLNYTELSQDTDYFLDYYNNEVLKISSLIKEKLYLAIYNNTNVFIFDDISKLRLFIKSRKRLNLLDYEYIHSISEYASSVLNSISQYIDIALNSDNTISIICSSEYIDDNCLGCGHEEYTFGYVRKKDLESLKSVLNISNTLFEYSVSFDEFNQYKNIIVSNLYYNKNEYYYDSLYPVNNTSIKNNWNDVSKFIEDLKHLYVLNLQLETKEELIDDNQEVTNCKKK